MVELATKKVEVEPGLVPRLAGGWLRPWPGPHLYLFKFVEKIVISTSKFAMKHNKITNITPSTIGCCGLGFIGS